MEYNCRHKHFTNNYYYFFLSFGGRLKKQKGGFLSEVGLSAPGVCKTDKQNVFIGQPFQRVWRGEQS